MRFDLDKLDSNGETFSRAYEHDALSFADTEVQRLTAPALIKGKIRLRRDQIELRGHLKAGIEVVCDRCLCPVEVPIETDFASSFTVGVPEEDQGVHELTADDLEVSVLASESFDLDEFAREQILVNVPARVLCRTDCKGLCPHCGADLNEAACECQQKEIDPRWSALAALRDKSS